ncbi:hypothetical protein [Bradyrhizobium sp. BR 10261]|uniref:hypothetical protein n=1 Tax=Bradyrhizobium sp. BR 10261 TaxID=2749992 RepID=UPI001C649BED|nr:hypothetical protein [Bradyrhizobium sp. BR 10261]MBW7966674.1 hypothetical protein [Bradyrhizobium sp. BR 10261]
MLIVTPVGPILFVLQIALTLGAAKEIASTRQIELNALSAPSCHVREKVTDKASHLRVILKDNNPEFNNKSRNDAGKGSYLPTAMTG